MAFLDYLVQKGILESRDIDTIIEESADSGDIEPALQKRGIPEEKLLNLKAEYFGVPAKNIDPAAVSAELLRYIPEESVLHYHFIPIGFADGVLEVGVIDPDNMEARDALQFIASKLGVPFKIFLISKSNFDALLENYRGLTGEVHQALSEIESEVQSENAPPVPVPSISDLQSGKNIGTNKKKISINKNGLPTDKITNDVNIGKGVILEDAPVTKIVGVILRHAIDGGASDVHIEPTAKNIRVRFRVDGVLYTSLQLPSAVLNAVVARIKVMANLKLDEKRKPQDGRFPMKLEERTIDLRVSTFPTYYGEKVVMRILDPQRGVAELEKTGLSEENIKKIREAIKRPYGMILLTGPTGSGKTTTLYAMLKELDRDKKNVVSLEDPVEYTIEGVSQSHVRPEIGYTFATGLRTTLRQDPDVVMVGEIRDKETAELAIQAALTGHLVLSTLHTNNAAGVVPRLVDMGIDQYLIAATLAVAIAQRLVKVICPDSKKPVPVTESIKVMAEKLFADLPAEFKKQIPRMKNVYEAVPSESCPGGTRGRTGVFELFVVDRDMEKVILTNPVESEIFRVARGQGMLTMKEDALIKALEGVIPFGEVNAL
ncbi:MAG: type II/IV secretion system protein [Parcubacteria group bacterium]|nr:type II/IV secretion system protein [Parcubacteria group bacterium]